MTVLKLYFYAKNREKEVMILKARIAGIGVVLLIILGLVGCGKSNATVLGADKENDFNKDYGVFISLDSSALKLLSDYETVVIDAQYFSKKDISYLKKKGCKVYSYLNVGSIEMFRDYYDTYEKYNLGDYENWEEEKWMDVSKKQWQAFLSKQEKMLVNKGVDGFFVDNCDVYYVYHTDKMFRGLNKILKHMKTYGKDIIINGGDTYVMEYKKRYGNLSDIMTGVNQESVWTSIDFKTRRLCLQNKETREYYQSYIENCEEQGLEVYLVEYTTNRKLKKKIQQYCVQKNYHYYISNSIELDGN